MDWMDCPLIERVPGKVSGAPIIKRSRVRPEDLVVNRAEGEEWLSYAYDLPVETVRGVLALGVSRDWGVMPPPPTTGAAGREPGECQKPGATCLPVLG